MMAQDFFHQDMELFIDHRVTRVAEQSGRHYIDGEKIFITNCEAGAHLVLTRILGLAAEGV
jgi:alkylation response protein AidB-like acyl-CoA dehydrogenase